MAEISVNIEYKDIVQKIQVLYMKSVGIALVGENGGVIGLRSGINKM